MLQAFCSVAANLADNMHQGRGQATMQKIYKFRYIVLPLGLRPTQKFEAHQALGPVGLP